METIADMIAASSYRLDATIPYTPGEGPVPDLTVALQETLLICNCPSYALQHRH